MCSAFSFRYGVGSFQFSSLVKGVTGSFKTQFDYNEVSSLSQCPHLVYYYYLKFKILYYILSVDLTSIVTHLFLYSLYIFSLHRRKERNVYLTTDSTHFNYGYVGVTHMFEDHSDSERGNLTHFSYW